MSHALTSRRVTRRRLGATAAIAALLGSTVSLAPSAVALDAAGQLSASRNGDDAAAKQTYSRLADARRRGPAPVRVDLLAINDFHGNLEVNPSTSSSGRINNTSAGGVAYLARHLKQLRAKARANDASTITVAAGDLIGASPLISAAFHDEPTIDAMDKLGLQVASVGNHEFDEGYRELLRLQRGGCIDDGDGRDNQNSCPGGRGFDGADFQYLSANVKWMDQGSHRRSTLLPATRVVKTGGVKVGFIGMTLEGTPEIVTKAGIQGLTFTDEVETANSLVPKLRARGVKAIVVLLHQGAVPGDPTAYDACSGVQGPAVDIAKALHPQIDAVVSGHTHQPYNCTVSDPAGEPRLLTSASSFGRMVTDVHLLVDPRSGNVIRPAAYAQNKIVTNDESVTPAPGFVRFVEMFKKLVAPIANEVIGHVAGGGDVSKTQNAAGESPLGDLIADSQLADDSTTPLGGVKPVAAFMNPGGIRADLVTTNPDDPDDETYSGVTYGAAFTVQPFNNFLVSMTLTGEQIDTLLEQQFSGSNATSSKILQISRGTSYTWSASAEPGEKVSNVVVDGEPLVLDKEYRIVVNSFLSDGGDGFTVLTQAQDKYVGGLDIDALSAYLKANDPYQPTSGDGRITRIP